MSPQNYYRSFKRSQDQ